MDVIGLLGIVVGLALLVGFSYRGWTVLLLAPAAALVAAALSGQPVLAHWTQVFMPAAAGFLAQFFPLFLMGAIFGKLMEDSGSVRAIAGFMTGWLGPRRALLAVVLAGAAVTYGGVSLFVAFFVLAPMGHAMFRAADLPPRLMPAAIALGTSTFTMSALPGTPAIQNAIPMPFFGTTAFAAPGLGLIAAAIMLGFGLWWLGVVERRARRAGEGYRAPGPTRDAATDPLLRERGNMAGHFDPAELSSPDERRQLDLFGAEVDGGSTIAAATTPGAPVGSGSFNGLGPPGIVAAALPLLVVVGINLLASLIVLPRLDTGYLAERRFGGVDLSAVGGVWAVLVALFVANLVLVALHWRRLADLKRSIDAGANAAVLPVLSVASLVGFGAVVASLPAFGLVKDWVLGIEGGPLVSLAVSTNLLAALTGSASGGLTIALEALGPTFMQVAHTTGLDPALLHRVAVIGAGTLDSLPHNGAVVSLLAVCGCTHKESYRDIVVVGIVGALLALVAVIVLGGIFGSF
ncbi:GntP family permease [Roseateles chitosanitabidus]|uniref:GntP family permease n=1 Tax=Roseateles chitosanitabidus TaxID=65048 RepID=UPI000AB8843C|nr:GntP family permease [Roseateles chitosanitabidus]